MGGREARKKKKIKHEQIRRKSSGIDVILEAVELKAELDSIVAAVTKVKSAQPWRWKSVMFTPALVQQNQKLSGGHS